ncbi:MAG: 16S rRNA (uracil(1498)-N(3))-methyltransferase [Nitrospirae bacterium]|nr:16S rRNA (uracil(1498)-N(3))-methyltransferase [Nitrospirota bacterium]
MTRLFLPVEKAGSDKITITGDNARYLSLVLRVNPGEQLVIFDGSGYRYICRILQVHKKEVVVEKIKKEPYSAESPVSITLAQGLPKSDKMDFIIQKATELGVSRIIPLITERSQVRHTEKVERWRKIALSASQQCGRERVPEIEEAVEIKEFLKNLHFPLQCFTATGAQPLFSKEGNTPPTPLDRGELFPPLKKGDVGGCCSIIFSEEHKERNLKKVLTGLKDIKQITLLIGPEGGFSKDEVAAAVERGFIEASLGPRILRTETAPIAAISIIQFKLGDMG